MTDLDLQVTGMNCASCAQHVTQALQSVPGVASAASATPSGLGEDAFGPAFSVAANSVSVYLQAMSYRTLEVEIDHGRVSSKGAEALPEKASGLLTILDSPTLTQPRPIGLAQGQFTVPDDFNAPLPEDILQTFEGE